MKKSAYRLHILAFFGLVFSVLSVLAESKLDLGKIKTLYKDAEFENVRISLEDFLRKSNATASREDNVSAYKYLGVIYASKPGGRPQAEAYFFRLLDIAPKVNLTELYVSSSVNEVFIETRNRFISEKQSANAVDEFGNNRGQDVTSKDDQGDAMALVANQSGSIGSSEQKGNKAPIKNEPRNSQTMQNKRLSIWPWILGATVLGGGIGLYVLTSQEKEPAIETINVGKPK
jgi:hypothetical protein